MPKDIDDLINSLGKLADTVKAQMLQDAENASTSIKQTGQPSAQALKDFIKTQNDYSKTIKSATAAQKALNDANARKPGMTLGRLPLASIGAALLGNKAAGARVGYALGNLFGGRGVQGGGGAGGGGTGGTGGGLGGSGGVGLGLGFGAAALIGSGFAASPTGSEVLTKPLEVLGATIGKDILPYLVKFGAALLDTADFLDKHIFGNEAKKRQQEEYGTTGFFAPVMKPFNYAKESAREAVAERQGDRLSDVIQENNRRREQGLAPLTPDEQKKRLGTIDGRGESLAYDPNRPKPEGDKNAELLIKEMLQKAGGTPKVGGNLADIAKDVQQASFTSGIENKLEQIRLEAVKNSENLVRAVKGE